MPGVTSLPFGFMYLSARVFSRLHLVSRTSLALQERCLDFSLCSVSLPCLTLSGRALPCLVLLCLCPVLPHLAVAYLAFVLPWSVLACLASVAVELEEPDSRTAALARGQEYLYGFEASALPKAVLDAVEEAGAETRRLAYERHGTYRHSSAT